MRFLLIALCIALLTACNTSDERLPLLYGEWQGVDWTDGVNHNYERAQAVQFSFNEDFSYTATLNNQVEEGDFVFREAKLYTTASGGRKVEKVVGVPQLEGDTLVLDMNRAGNPETLILVRQ